MSLYQCRICTFEQESASVPVVCMVCGSEYTEWLNLSTNKLECVQNPAKNKVPHKPVAPKPVAPKPVAPKPVAPKPVAPKLKFSWYMGYLSVSRTNIDVKIPLGSVIKEKIILKNSGKTKITGIIYSNNAMVSTSIKTLDFIESAKFDIIIDTSHVRTASKHFATIVVDSSIGDYTIYLEFETIRVPILKSLKYMFIDWD